MTTNKPEVVGFISEVGIKKLREDEHTSDWTLYAGPVRNSVTPLIRLSDYEALQAECKELMSALKRISYQASGHECRQTPTSDLQRAFADLMRQADDALYCFYNNGLPKQRFCEYAGCCEPAVEEALCLAHLEDWREQQAIDAAMEPTK